jgi:hypothetical protein
MTADATTISLDAIDAALAAAVPGLGEDEQRLAGAVLRLLAAGEPVSIPAAAAGLLGQRAEQALRSRPAAEPGQAAAKWRGKTLAMTGGGRWTGST